MVWRHGRRATGARRFWEGVALGAVACLLGGCGAGGELAIWPSPTAAAVVLPSPAAAPTPTVAVALRASATAAALGPEGTIRAYFADINRGAADAALALLTPHWRAPQNDAAWRGTYQRERSITLLSVQETAPSLAQPPSARAERREYMVELNVPLAHPGAWNPGRNTRFVGLLHTDEGWRINAINSSPGYLPGDIASVAVSTAVGGSPTPGATPAASGACRAGEVCDAQLGVALTPPAGWEVAPPGHYPPGELVFWRTPAPGQANADQRLSISALGTTADRDDAQAANVAAEREIRQSNASVPISRQQVRYGGAAGVLLRGMPSNGPVAAIILARAGALYRILAPGNALAPDQQQALQSLRFLPRVGPFPTAP